MLELKKLSRTYVTKNKDEVRALEDVSLTFPDKGLCLILGKSGCGKTTLLNILGGLDVRYNGDFIFLNKKLSGKDFADYRKNYVSFVFQDFNLIEDLDISENLSIGYNFANKDGANKQEYVLNEVGLDGYEYRFPQELSGGEQQRVAIARALLKDSKVLLADEPTGNLDKENSVDIYKLLKEISLKKLVIVVSHDEQLAREYADYVVRLDEGKVVENNLPQIDCAERYEISKRRAIRAKIAWQMAWYEFTRKKSRSIVTVIALIVCLSLVAFAIPLMFYNSADPHYAVVTKNGYDKILLNNLTYQNYMSLREEGVNVALCNVFGDSSQSSLVFQSKEEALAYGIEFYPCEKELPLQNDTYYISDKYLKEIILYGNNKAIINGEEKLLNLTDYELTDVVGGKLAALSDLKTCAGVYYYPEQKFNSKAEESYGKEHFGQYITTDLGGDNLDFLFIKVGYEDKLEFLTDNTQVYDTLTSNDSYIGESYEYVLLDTDGNVTPLDGNSNNHLMKENTVYLNLACFNGTFNKRYKYDDLIDWTSEEAEDGTVTKKYFSKLVPAQIGLETYIEVTNRETRQTESVSGLSVGGIVINVREYSGDNGYKMWIGGKDNLLKYRMLVNNFYAWADRSSVAQLKGGSLRSGMRSLSRDYDCGFYTPATSAANDFEKHQLKNTRATVLYVAIAMSVVTLLSIVLLISGQILSRKREVGIFKALGARNLEVSTIYIYESIIMTAFVAVFSVVLSVLEVLAFNVIISAQFAVLTFYAIYAVLAVSVIVVLFALGTLLPLIILNRLNVIDSIRNKAGK